MHPRPLACAALAVATVALAGCGGDGALSASTAIDSPAQRAALSVAYVASARNIPTKDHTPIVDCIVDGLEARGVTTHGQLRARAHRTLARRLSATCAERVLSGDRASSGTGKVKSGY